MPDGLFDDAGTRLLRAALAGYTVDAVTEAIGLAGQSALQRRDLTGAARTLHGRDDRLATLIRLFLLGGTVDEELAARAFDPLPSADVLDAGVLEQVGPAVRAGVDLRPYGETAGDVTAAVGAVPGISPDVASPGGSDWWVVSDLGSDVRPGALRADHVLGVGTASLTLTQAVPRDHVGRALDVGTGSGVQALHLAEHADEVVATDVSTRALRLAATTAALSGQRWDLRRGSLFEPVAGERFDLVVANPPFVVSDGAPGWEYRDSGLAGDAVTERLLRDAPAHLTDGGSAHLLANWIIPADGDWRARVGGWLTGGGCDAWVWQREVAEPGEYVALWLRDAGLTPATPEWVQRYDAWLDWFAANEVVAVGMGLVSLWQSRMTNPSVVLEDVPQAVAQLVGPELSAWVRRRRWLVATPDDHMLAARLRAAPGVVRDRADVLGPTGWVEGTQQLRQSFGLRWAVDTDDAVAALVAGCDGATPLARAVDLLAAAVGLPVGELHAAVLPVVRDLVGRGFLLPPDDGAPRPMPRRAPATGAGAA